MSSHDDDAYSARARASVPGPSGAPDDRPGGPAAYRNPTGGRASVGTASVGSASVGRATPGRAQAGGSAPVAGSARVGGRAGVPEGTGRASVGAASARASVRPLSELNLSEPAPVGSGGKGGKGTATASKRAKRRRRANILTAAAAVFVILLGSGVVAFTWFYDGVGDISPKAEDQMNSIQYADGKEMTKFGEQRTLVPSDQISPLIKEAVMGAEDKEFLNHHGIDMLGIARAAWNNLTGGGGGGASTITQQYARYHAKQYEISYARKAREAIMARKIEGQYTKDQIIGFYLNAIYFGRGAHGIEAAAQAYFNKSSIAKPGDPKALTFEEAAVIASVIKQPEPDKSTGHKGYDPQFNLPAAKDRWEYTLNNMLEKKWITPEQRAAAVYPKWQTFEPDKCRADCTGKTPLGHVKDQVMAELKALGYDKEMLLKGGYQIKTTINSEIQKAAQDASQLSSDISPMKDRPKTYQAALVAIDPNTGGVSAYYGGDDGTAFDFAGLNDNGSSGGHSPGSTFKIYTLAAALREGVSFDSVWNSRLKDGKREISNAGRVPDCGESCTLEHSTIESYNFPFYWLAKGMGEKKVLEAARDAGIRTIFNTEGKPVDLTNNNVSGNGFDHMLGYGQYPITVLDHANGIATFTAGGIYHKAHFVQEIWQKNESTGQFDKKYVDATKAVKKFDSDIMADLDGVLAKIPEHNGKSLKGGRQAVGKTGTWELNEDTAENGDAWMVGGIPQLAAAVWVGNNIVDDKGRAGRGAIKEKANGREANMQGGRTPGKIWQTFMDLVADKLDYKKLKFPERIKTGSADTPLANGVKRVDPVQTCDPAIFGIEVCQAQNAIDPNNPNNGQGNNGPPQGGNGPGDDRQGNDRQGDDRQGNDRQGNDQQGDDRQGDRRGGNNGGANVFTPDAQDGTQTFPGTG